MSTTPRRGLRIDDPVAAGTAHTSSPTDRAGTDLGAEVGEIRICDLSISEVRRNTNQPRKRFDETSIASLAESIRQRGVLQPIIVRPVPGGGYELVAGERRWRAAKLAGATTILALIDDRLDSAGSLELALIENVAREGLSPIEEARTIALLLEDLQVTAALLAKRLGRSRTDVVHSVRLLDLPDEAIRLIDAGALTKGHGKALLADPDHHRRRTLARRAAAKGWSIRTLEAEITRTSDPPKPTPEPHPDACAAAADLQDAITTATGCNVQARARRDRYQVILDQAAAEQLTKILSRTAREG